MPLCAGCSGEGLEVPLEHIRASFYRCPECSGLWETRQVVWQDADGREHTRWEHDAVGWGLSRWTLRADCATGRISQAGARWLYQAQLDWCRSLQRRPTITSQRKQRDSQQRKTSYCPLREGHVLGSTTPRNAKPYKLW